MTDPPVRGRGHFQWSAGAWFGAQLGSTLWMALGGAVLLARPDVLGLVPLLCCAVANVVGALLWRSRGRLAPYPAFQILLIVVGACAWVALSFLTEGLEEATRYQRGLLLFPILMAGFHLLERAAVRSRSPAE